MKNNILEEFENFCEDLYCWVDDDMGGHMEAVIGDQIANTKLGYLVLKGKIENVLSELEEYKKHKKYHCEQLEKVLSEIESYKNRENKELETYKKIAEKLAEEVKKDVVYYDRTGIVSCELYDKCSKNTNGALCVDCIIDWARKEVENGK